MVDTPTISKNIQNLEARYASLMGENKISLITANISSSSPKAYIAISIMVFFILVISRPSILYEEEALKEPKFSYQKFFLYFIGISFLLNLALFAYNYKKNLN
jgi:hypothetical protein